MARKLVDVVLAAAESTEHESLHGLFAEIIEDTKFLLGDNNPMPSDKEILDTIIALMDSGKLTLKTYFCLE